MASNDITINFEGKTITAQATDSIAATLLKSGEHIFSRSAKFHRPRGPFCLSGACSHCLMEVNGQPNIRTCQTPVQEDMQITRQNSFPSASMDILGVLDWLFPKGMDHHKMFAKAPGIRGITLKVARALSGLGTLPTQPVDLSSINVETDCGDVLIIGGGPSGLTHATNLAQQGFGVILFESQTCGGHLNYGFEPNATDHIKQLKQNALTAGVTLHENTPVHAIMDKSIVIASSQNTLYRMSPRVVIIATGSYPRMLSIPGNDIPMVMALSAYGKLLSNYNYAPVKRLAIISEDDSQAATINQAIQLFNDHGISTVSVHEQRPYLYQSEVLEIAGSNKVRNIRAKIDGRSKNIKCDGVAIAAKPILAYELAYQVGLKVVFDSSKDSFSCVDSTISEESGTHMLAISTGQLRGITDYNSDSMTSVEQEVTQFLQEVSHG